MLDAVRYDLSYALRGLRRSPGLTVAIVLSFALGIGVNASLFSVVDRVFFQAPSGLADPGNVRRLTGFARGAGGTEYPSDDFTTTDHASLQEAAAGLAEIEGYDPVNDAKVGERGEVHTVAYATTGFFHFAGVHPSLGRFFNAEENRYGDPRNVAILNYDYWQHALHGDSAILGRALRIDSTLFTVIGIAPRRFDGLDLDVVDVWVPLASLPPGMEGPWWHGGFQIIHLFARLQPGADARRVQSRLDARYRSTYERAARLDPGLHLEAAPLLQARGAIRLGRQDERALALILPLAGLALLVLVVAASNVASLLLMRALRRRREMAVRVALGVSPQRLFGQLLVESLLLALVGGLGALLIAAWTGGALRALLLSDIHWTRTIVDGRLISFALGSALLMGVAAGLAPATITLHRDIGILLRGGGAEAGRPRSTLRVALLATQTALCMTMLAAAGMFLQSLRRATELDVGYEPRRLITIAMHSFGNDAGDAALAERIAALPAVALVARSSSDVRGSGVGSKIMFANGDTVEAIAAPTFAWVEPSYAATVGLQLTAGRFIGREDAAGTQPVVVINEAFAKRFWRDRSPIGECIFQFSRARPCLTIVGIVRTAQWDPSAEPGMLYYMPATQAQYRAVLHSINVRTRGPATRATTAAIERIIKDVNVDPDNPPVPRLVSDRLAPVMRPWRIGAGIFTILGLLALAAASAGIYGLIGYEVTQRTHEIGVRVTLGATPGAILRMIVGSGLRIVGVGLAVGIICALAAGRVVASLLFDTSPFDPAVLVVTGATIAGAALVASLAPGWRATRVDPVVALRAD